jgi:regulator of protease activity HflC (stomatin/prohibitin superfamily)
MIGFILFALVTAFLWYWAYEGRSPIAGIAGAFTAVLAVAALGFVQIQPGHVGVVTSFGEVHEEEMTPGLHWRFPIINQVDEVDTRVRAVRVEGYTAASQEQQDLFLNITLNYHVIPDKASDIIQNIGTDFESKIVMPRFLDIPKSITDDYKTVVVLNSRDEIRQKAKEELSRALEPFGLIVDTINIENFSYSPEYNAEIEAKQAAQQRVETEKQNREQARIRAETAKIEAEGRANARIEEARGEAEANRLLTESLTDQLLNWQAIQKLNPNVQVMLVPSDNGFILDLKGLTPTASPAP